jgi:hypothetical protein
LKGERSDFKQQTLSSEGNRTPREAEPPCFKRQVPSSELERSRLGQVNDREGGW